MKIQLPIDTSAVSFIDVMPPEPVLDRQTKQAEGRRQRRAAVLDRAPLHRREGRRGSLGQVPRHSPGGDSARACPSR